jgi:diguanylate cyclase (GGDEF)-like protein
MKKSILFALIGFGLGWGAPLGALLILYFSPHEPAGFFAGFETKGSQASFFLIYMLVGTCTAFALFGYGLGRYADQIQFNNRKLSYQALTDPLTGLGNHRFLHEAFQRQYRNRKTDAEPISCLMMDLDLFKKVNDSYGHPFGDEVLAIFAAIIDRMIRPWDVAARYGGEEFMCILPRCGKEEARQVAERIRAETQKEIFYFNKSQVRITVSIGVATHEGLRKDYLDLISLADQALYKAKESGRNKVVVI